MTLTKIKEAAIRQFTLNGYEKASLAGIAAEVGIKKQSIYTYFKSKKELFAEVITDVFAGELAFIGDFFAQEKELEVLLYEFLLEYQKRYQKNNATRFWLRMSFFAPEVLEKQTLELTYLHLDTLEEILQKLFPADPDAAAAYLGVLDSLSVELLYGGEQRAEKRLQASWHIYQRGIRKNKEWK